MSSDYTVLSKYNQDSIDNIIRNGNLDDWKAFRDWLTRENQSFTLRDTYSDGSTILQKAVSHGVGQLSSVLLEEDSDTVDQKNELRVAIMSIDGETVTCQPGDTALHVAFRVGHIGIAQLLINKSADRNVKNHAADTPLHVWAASGYFEGLRSTTVDMGLINDYITELNELYTSERVFASKLLCGVSVEEENNESGRRPIHCAAALGHSSIVTTLLMVNADVAAQDENGYQPLHVAAGAGHCDTINILLLHGAEPTATTNEGLTPMDIALSFISRQPHAEGVDPNTIKQQTEHLV